MKLSDCNVKFSSIVEIAELVQKIETETDRRFLKLHRGVIDVTTIDMNWIKSNLDLNTKALQHYSPNDGNQQLIETIKTKFYLQKHNVLITPGGMAALDLIISSLADNQTFWLPTYHWGSWNKIIQLQNKKIESFDDFNLNSFNPKEGVVMLCFPSNPTGYQPELSDIKEFIMKCKKNNVTIVLDMPYFYLFNEFNTDISDLIHDNVIVSCSFSKSVGLSGYRIGYVATTNKELYSHLRIRSLYKYNSISTVAQQIILNLLTSGTTQIEQYKKETLKHIKKNIDFLLENNLLFDSYTNTPVGPFAIIKRDYDTLMKNNISSVPLNKFVMKPTNEDNKLSRISVAVSSEGFINCMAKII